MKTSASQIDFTATSLMAGVIEYYSLDGTEIVESVKLLNLIDYIEKNNLNYEEITISSADGDPQKEDGYEVTHDVIDWLDMYADCGKENFEMVTEMYYREVIARKELSHAA